MSLRFLDPENSFPKGRERRNGTTAQVWRWLKSNLGSKWPLVAICLLYNLTNGFIRCWPCSPHSLLPLPPFPQHPPPSISLICPLLPQLLHSNLAFHLWTLACVMSLSLPQSGGCCCHNSCVISITHASEANEVIFPEALNII